MAKPRSQPERRRSFNNTDQYGRKWLVTIEVDTGHPTGQLMPCFNDTMGTPQKYLSVPDESPRSVVINVDLWVTDLKRALVEYRKAFDEIGMALYADNYDAEKAWADPRPSHREHIGPRPLAWRKVQKYHDELRDPVKEQPAEAVA